MEDLQIVNGAQTSHSLFEVATSSPDALTDVILTVRVYETSRADIIERVAVATNSQARIQSRDLRANNNVLKKMEYAFAEKGYFFERKRNMHSDKDPKRRIDALKLGQVIMAYLLREPEKAKTDSNAIFGNLFPVIFNEHHNIDALCTIYQVYQQIETMRDNYICKQEDDSHDAKYQYLVYGHWFVLYTVMLLVVDSKEPLKSGTGAIPILEKALDVVAAACGKSKPTSHYQLFRSAKTKDRIIVELDGKQPSLFSLLVKSNDGWLLD